MMIAFQSGLDYADDLIGGMEVTLGPSVDINAGSLDILLVATGYIGFEIEDIFQAGLRASLAILTGENNQLALGPFVELTTDLYVTTRLIMNLNAPAGFAFDGGGVWGLHIGGGGQL